jgi:hypothetical protein
MHYKHSNYNRALDFFLLFLMMELFFPFSSFVMLRRLKTGLKGRLKEKFGYMPSQ